MADNRLDRLCVNIVDSLYCEIAKTHTHTHLHRRQYWQSNRVNRINNALNCQLKHRLGFEIFEIQMLTQFMFILHSVSNEKPSDEI